MNTNCDKLIAIQKAKYEFNDEKLWADLRHMTVREIALTPLNILALEAGISRSAIYDHEEAYQRIIECREYEAQRVKGLKQHKK